MVEGKVSAESISGFSSSSLVPLAISIKNWLKARTWNDLGAPNDES